MAALKECDPDNPDAIYPQYTVHLIFLSFLYKTLDKACSNLNPKDPTQTHFSSEEKIQKHREAFQRYYTILSKLTGQKSKF